MKKFLAFALATLISLTAIADEVKKNTEMFFLPNAVGGFVVLDAKDCPIPALRERGFVGEAYVSNAKDERIYGCWTAPSSDEEGPIDPRMEAIVTVVILYNGVFFSQEYFSSQFSSEKVRPNLDGI
jgi:hypothetical protein